VTHQTVSPDDFWFGSQGEAITITAHFVRRLGWGTDNAAVWDWLMGLAAGEQDHGRGSIDAAATTRSFAEYLAALHAAGDPKAERLGVEVARRARRDVRGFGPYAQRRGGVAT